MDHEIKREHLPYFNHGLISKSLLLSFSEFTENASVKPENIITQHKKVIEENPQNVLLFNLLNLYLTKSLGSKQKTKNDKHKIIKKITDNEKGLASAGSKKIRSGSTILAYSINNSLFEILKHANKHKKITLNLFTNTFFEWETKLSENLNIKTNFFHPFELNEAIEESDICLFGADVLLKNGVICRKGTKIISKTAKQNQVPTYFCSSLLKYDFNKRLTKVLNHTKKNKKIYEKISENEITGVVTERGIHKIKNIEREAIQEFSLII